MIIKEYKILAQCICLYLFILVFGAADVFLLTSLLFVKKYKEIFFFKVKNVEEISMCIIINLDILVFTI